MIDLKSILKGLTKNILLTNFVAAVSKESFACERGSMRPRTAEFTELVKLDLPAPKTVNSKGDDYCQII